MMNAKGASFGADQKPAEQVVGVVSIKSPIYKYSQECGPRGKPKAHMRVLDYLKDDQSVAGVVLDIDSGGGQGIRNP